VYISAFPPPIPNKGKARSFVVFLSYAVLKIPYPFIHIHEAIFFPFKVQNSKEFSVILNNFKYLTNEQ
jgi:hypothetical protein